MEIVGARIVHNSFGEGIVESYDEDSGNVKIIFGSVEKELSLEIIIINNKVKFDDPLLQEEVEKYIKDKQELKKQVADQAFAEMQQRIKLAAEKAPAKKKQSNKQNTNNRQRRRNQDNIAFKCTYCDGGIDSNGIGFCGICSDENIKANIEDGRIWCKASECYCYQYYKKIITREALESIYGEGGALVCYESNLFRSWYYEAGTVVNGENNGKPKTIRGGNTDSLCILTTQKPNEDNEQRYIFGVFIINKLEEGDAEANKVGRVTAHQKYRLMLTEDEASKMRFWNYYQNDSEDNPNFWGSGLFRYVDDDTSIKILEAIAELKKGTSDEELAAGMLEYYKSKHK